LRKEDTNTNPNPITTTDPKPNPITTTNPKPITSTKPKRITTTTNTNPNPITSTKPNPITTTNPEPFIVIFDGQEEQNISIYTTQNASFADVRSAIRQQWDDAPIDFTFINEIGAKVNIKQENFGAFQKEKIIRIKINDHKRKLDNDGNSKASKKQKRK